MGQGFTNGLAQLCADTLGVRPERVTVVIGDTDACPVHGTRHGREPFGLVGGAGRAQVSSGCQLAIRGSRRTCSSADDDLVFEDGVIWVAGTPTRSVTMADIGPRRYLRASSSPDLTQASR